MKKKQKKYTYYLEEDKHSHIILWLKTQGNRAEAVRAALDFYVQHQAEMVTDSPAGQVIDKQIISEAVAGALVRPEFLGMIRKVVEAAVQDVLGSVQLKDLPTEAARDDGIFLDEISGNFIVE